MVMSALKTNLLSLFVEHHTLSLVCPDTQLQQVDPTQHEAPMAGAAVPASGEQVCARHSQHLCAKGLWGHRQESCIPR